MQLISLAPTTGFKFSLPSGSWLLPSIALGGLVWVEIISAVVAYFV